MKTLIAALAVLSSALSSASASAEALRCDSPQIQVIGEIQRKYVNMGKYSFRGQLQILSLDHRRIVSVSNFQVHDGVAQDDYALRVDRANDQDGRAVSLEIYSDSDRPSVVTIGDARTEFFPVCELSSPNSSPAPESKPGTPPSDPGHH